MKISYKVENGIKHLTHPHPAFVPVPVDDDELIANQAQDENGSWLQENLNPNEVSNFWGGVVEDLRSKGELNEYHDEEAEGYREDPAYK